MCIRDRLNPAAAHEYELVSVDIVAGLALVANVAEILRVPPEEPSYCTTRGSIEWVLSAAAFAVIVLLAA